MKRNRSPFKWGELVLVKAVLYRRNNIRKENEDGSTDWLNRWIARAPEGGESRLGIFLGCVTLRDVAVPLSYNIHELCTVKTHRAARVCFRGRKPVYALISDLVKAEVGDLVGGGK